MWMLGDQVYLARVMPTVGNIDDKAKWYVQTISTTI